MASDDDIQLPDLQVIQRYSLAVRGASAPRAELIATLQADLDWLSGGRRRTVAPAASAAPAAAKPAPAKSGKTPAKAAKKSATAKR
jgi:hypothetical protein